MVAPAPPPGFKLMNDNFMGIKDSSQFSKCIRVQKGNDQDLNQILDSPRSCMVVDNQNEKK